MDSDIIKRKECVWLNQQVYLDRVVARGSWQVNEWSLIRTHIHKSWIFSELLTGTFCYNCITFTASLKFTNYITQWELQKECYY